MSTTPENLDFFLDTLSLVPDISGKKMFGEYGIYSGDRMFALACDNTLFFKTTPETIHLFEDRETRAYPGSKNTAQANGEWLEDREQIASIAKIILEHTPLPKIKKRK